MPFHYEANPFAIEKESFRQIRELTTLDGLTRDEQQVAMRVVHSLGMPQLVQQIRFSSDACASGKRALAANCNIICDVEMVKQGITKRMINKEPLCFLNCAATTELATARGETRSMAAVDQWRDVIAGSVVIIGNAPTALFRLLERLSSDREDAIGKPALIVGMPVGFVGAAESKQALWDHHSALGVPCITLLGREGGSSVSAASCNALLRCNLGEYY